MDFEIDKIGWTHEFHQRGGIVGNFMTNRVALPIYYGAKNQVGIDTGSLLRSIHFNIQYGAILGDDIKVSVGSDDKIALIHHNGTRPHHIVPINGKALRFNYRGRIVYRTHVYHPGTKPNRYLSDPMTKVISRFR